MSLSCGEDHNILTYSEITMEIGLTKLGLENYEKVL